MATKRRDSRIIEEMLETARGLQGAGLITKRRMGEKKPSGPSLKLLNLRRDR